jgi:hypothetical protein
VKEGLDFTQMVKVTCPHCKEVGNPQTSAGGRGAAPVGHAGGQAPGAGAQAAVATSSPRRSLGTRSCFRSEKSTRTRRKRSRSSALRFEV